jgi:hypothetical protein
MVAMRPVQALATVMHMRWNIPCGVACLHLRLVTRSAESSVRKLSANSLKREAFSNNCMNGATSNDDDQIV